MNAQPHFLVFETGGTKLVAAVAGPDRRIIESTVVYREPDDLASTSFCRIVDAAGNLQRKFVSEGADFQAIGFGFGGTVRRSTNRPHLCLHEEGWADVDVVGDLASRFGLPVFVENDCKLAALAESHFGAGAGASSVFYVTLGTGVGGGLVRGGQIQALGDIGEAEIGHVVVAPEGPDCWCGGRGCVESVCSGPGMSRLASLLAERHLDLWRASSLFSDAPPDSARLISSWNSGDKFASLVVEQSAAYLAAALAATVNLMAPEKIVIGGGLGTASERMLDLVRERTTPLVVHYFRSEFEIDMSALREQVVTQGAAILAAQKVGSVERQR